MSKKNVIVCPNCGTSIDVEDIISHQLEEDIKKKFNAQLADEKKKYEKERELLNKAQAEFEQKKLKENEIFQEKLESKIKEERKQIEEKLSKKLKEEQSEQFLSLQKELNEKSLQVQELNKTKIEIEKLKREKDEIKGIIEAESQKKITEIVLEEKEKIRKTEEEKNELKVKELLKQLEDQKKLTEEMKRKQEQGSMQLQGEVQELALEEMLKKMFPFDLIEEVGKGVRGADAVQIVRNNLGQICGKIIYESKRTKSFTNDWIEKLKSDMRSTGADISVIVTETMPKDMERFGQKDGIWICNFSEAKSLAVVLRDSLVRIHSAMVSQDNKGDKMQMLYDYLTSNEFKQQMEAIVEGFMSMRLSIIKERMQMEKLWKEREKQLDKVLLNATGFYSSVKGIAGNAVADIKLLEGDLEEPNLIE